MRHVLSVLSKEKVQSNCTKCAIPVMVVGLKAVQILITDREKAKGAFQETGENLVQIAKERHCSKLEYVCAVVEAMERNLASMQTHQKSVKNVKGTFFTDKMGDKKCFDECYNICFLNICEKKHP